MHVLFSKTKDIFDINIGKVVVLKSSRVLYSRFVASDKVFIILQSSYSYRLNSQSIIVQSRDRESGLKYNWS